MTRITLTGRNHTTPDCRSDWQREQAEPPFQEERQPSLLGWALCVLVGVAFWAALLAAVLS